MEEDEEDVVLAAPDEQDQSDNEGDQESDGSATAPRAAPDIMDASDFTKSPDIMDASDFQKSPDILDASDFEKPKAEGKLAGGVREFLHGIVPGIAALPGMAVGAAGGAAIGGPLAPVTGFAGAVAGGMATAGVAANLQDRALKAIGFDDDAQRAANAAENPVSTGVGGLLGNSVGFSPGKLADPIIKRLLGAGVMGGIDVGQQLGEKGEVDPTQLAISTAGGFVFNRQNRFGKKVTGATERLLPRRATDGAEVPPPDPAQDQTTAARSENLKTGVGNAQEQAPPSRDVTGVGNQDTQPSVRDQAPGTNQRRWEKRIAEARAEDEGITEMQPGELPADTKAALADMQDGNTAVTEVKGTEPAQTPAIPNPEPQNPAQSAGTNAIPNQEQVRTPPEQTMPGARPGDATQIQRPVAPRSPEGVTEVSRLERDAVDRTRQRMAEGQQGEAFKDVGEPGSVPTLPGEGGPRQAPPEDMVNRSRSGTTEPPVPVEAPKAPGRVLEDISQSLPPAERAAALEKASKFTERVMGEGPARAPEPKKASGSYEVKDADGRVVGHAKTEALARRRSNSLRAARETMAEFTPPEGADKNALHDWADRVVDHARTRGWTKYMPREKGESHLEAPREAMWMDEVAALANRVQDRKTGEMRRKPLRTPEDFAGRERLLRTGDENAVETVRAERREKGDLRMRRGPTVDETEAGGGKQGKQINVTSKEGEAPAPVKRIDPNSPEGKAIAERVTGAGKPKNAAPMFGKRGGDETKGEFRAEDNAVYAGEDANIRVKTTKPTVKLSEALHPDEQMFIGGEHMENYPDLAKALVAAEPNIPVHRVAPETLSKMFGGKPTDGMYDYTHHAIFVAEGASRNTLLHEAVHGALGRKIEADPVYAKKITDYMKAIDPTGDLAKLHPEAYENEHEFLAYGMTEPSFQSALSRTRLQPSLAAKLGLTGKMANAFDGFVRTAQRILGLGNEHHSALHGVMKLAEEGMNKPALTDAQTKMYREQQGKEVKRLAHTVQEVRDEVDGRLKQMKSPWFIRARDSDKLAQASDYLFNKLKMDNPLRTISNHWEEARVKALDYAKGYDETLGREGFALREADPEGHAKMSHLMQLESQYQRYGDLPLNKQGFKTQGHEKAFRDSKHPELERLFNDLPDEMKDHRADLYEFTKKRHEELLDQNATNVLEKMVGIKDPALAKRYMDGTHTEAEYKRLGKDDRERESNLETIQNVLARDNIVGPYTPFIRRGEHAVVGKYHMKDTGNEVANSPNVDDNSREFKSKADAEDFATKQHGTTKVQSYYVDKKTGERYSQGKDDIVLRDGKPVLDPQGNPRTFKPDVAYDRNDPNVEQRWKATVQRGYLKMHDTYRDALAHEADLKKTNDFEKTDVQKKRYQPQADAIALASRFGDLEAKFKNNTLYENMNANQKQAVKQLMAEQQLQSLASTHGANSRLHRNYVAGADDNLLRNMQDYSRETGNRLARQEHQPAIDTAFDDARDAVNKSNLTSNAIQKVLNEFSERENSMKNQGFSLASGQMGPIQQRVMSVSYMARLASPGFTIRNLTQLPMNTWAEVGGRHGLSAAGREMMKVYRDIGAGKTLMGGIKDTGKAMAGKLTDPVTFVSDIRNRLSDPLDKAIIDHVVKRGRLDPDAGFQMAEMIERVEPQKLNLFNATKDNVATKGVEKSLELYDTAQHWSEQVSRQLPRAAETINRAGSALMAGRMEYKKAIKDGLSTTEAKAKALEYADDVVRNTQYVYSDTNKPTWARNPFARAAFQFKQFGKSTYELMGRHIGNVIQSQDPEMRKASLKTLGGLFVTHTVMAGALGLPWEPVRALLIGAKAAGVTSKEWDDVENSIREHLAAFGGLAGLNEKDRKKLGEVLSRGLPRLIGMDFSPGVGVDNMLLFSSPRSGTDRDMDNNLSAWFFQMAGGAPAGLALQGLHGLRDMAGGNYAEGIAKLSMLKIGADVIKAEEGYRHGKVNARGRETMTPYSGYEAGVKAMGIPVAREAEQNAFAHTVYQKGQEIKDAKSKATAEWLSAKTPEAKATAQKAAIDAGLQPKDLFASRDRERNANKRVVNGVVTTKATKPIARDLSDVYNLRRD